MKFSFNKTSVIAAILSVAFIAGSAYGAAHTAGVIKERKALMKEVVLKGLKAMKQMVKDDFIDAPAAAKYMDNIAKVADGFAKRFPKGTETGFETTAAPTIWQDTKDFEARLVKFAADAKAASAAAGKGDAAFKKAFVTVAKNCKGCHEKFRIKKK